MLLAALALILAYQSLLFGALAKVFAIGEGLLPRDPARERVFEVLTLERGLILGTVLTGAGGLLILRSVAGWAAADLGPLDYSGTMRVVIPGVTAVALGVQTVLASFFLSILGLRRL